VLQAHIIGRISGSVSHFHEWLNFPEIGSRAEAEFLALSLLL
jgi:hypothetical protein